MRTLDLDVIIITGIYISIFGQNQIINAAISKISIVVLTTYLILDFTYLIIDNVFFAYYFISEPDNEVYLLLNTIDGIYAPIATIIMDSCWILQIYHLLLLIFCIL